MKKRHLPRVLGVYKKGKSVFLWRLSSPYTFQIEKSNNGLIFTPFKKWGEIVKSKGEQERIEDCQDFRLSKIDNRYFLTYKLRSKKENRLCGAFWGGFSHWQKIGPIDKIKEMGMVVPEYLYKNKYYLLYFGEKEIKLALSKDLEYWETLSSPIFVIPPKFKKEKFLIKIGTIFVTGEKIFLIYFLYKNKKNSSIHSVNVIIWNKEKLHERPQIIEEPILFIKEKKPLLPVGAVRFGDQIIAYWQTEDGEVFSANCPFSFKKDNFLKPIFFIPILKKFLNNPIIKPLKKRFWESKAVFNTGVFTEGGKVHFIYRAVGEEEVSVWGYAKSSDGLHIDEREKNPILSPLLWGKKNQFFQLSLPFYFSGGGLFGGFEDPRVTKLDERIYVTFTFFDGYRPPGVGLTSIKKEDFLMKKWRWQKPVLISPPGEIHKNWAIFPEKINGKYAIIHSLSPRILIDYFEDLDFKGKFFIKSYYDGEPQEAIWEERIRGIGPPPIKTNEGWLIFYHAMDKDQPHFYKIGAMLLDLKDPTRILYRCSRPVLEPDQNYELEGIKPGIVYSCGGVVFQKRIFLYYGGADTVVCAAYAFLDDFLCWLKSKSNIPYSNFKLEKINYVNN